MKSSEKHINDGKYLRLMILISVIPTIIGIENIVSYFNRKDTAFGISVKIADFFLGWIVRGFYPNIIYPAVTAVIAIGIEFIAAVNIDAECYDVTRKGRKRFQKVAQFVCLICSLPLARLIWLAFSAMLNDMLGFISISLPSILEYIITGLIYLLLFSMIFSGDEEESQEKKAVNIKTREAVGPDGKKYVLPANYETGRKYMQFEPVEGSPVTGNLHQLLWNSETKLLALQEEVLTARERNSIPYFALAHCWENKKGWNDCLYPPCSAEYIDMQKAVQFYEIGVELEWIFIKKTNWVGYGLKDPWKEMRESCQRLIEIYQRGCPGVAASQDKVSYYTDLWERFDAKCKKNYKKEAKKKEEWRLREAGRSYARSVAPQKTSHISEPEAETPFVFPTYIYDSDENPWELINSGYDNATYYCQKAGQSETFYKSDFDIGAPVGFHRR